ncbi:MULTISPECIES: CPBP family intramembrane glutamic endopeptidase [unclassified Microbacterium]|uniref:CPBP family intramembrane glutamic endopeptidase n=1 Tax=unclassified Microbacterium TaxID=2609290 RepID=UPI0012FCBDE7|nr:type II CAAX endopeptidase family protein [Microbacterium sp. MAH-37]MVQ41536.1 CPBP family intramembrane metalloprotease [Microbacterium sp. MAH-37]
MTGISTPRVTPRIWIGLVAVAVYVAVGAGIANLLLAAIAVEDPMGRFLLAHLPVLIPLAIAGIVFVWWAGWNARVWQTAAPWETRPRRWWLLVFPVLLLIQSGVTLGTSDWGRWTVGGVVLVALVCLLVGFGEELYFRGILRASIREHHGETLALVITAAAFGIAHTLSSALQGMPVGGVLFQVAVTSAAGAVYYGAFLATGRLWVPIVLHALDDFSLHISGADLTMHPIADATPSPLAIATQGLLWALTVVLLISCIRRDRAARHLAAGRTVKG